MGKYNNPNSVIGGGVEGFVSPLEGLIIFELISMISIIHNVAVTITPKNSPLQVPAITPYIILFGVIMLLQPFILGVARDLSWTIAYIIGAIIGIVFFFFYGHLNNIYPDMIIDTLATIVIIIIGMAVRIVASSV